MMLLKRLLEDKKKERYEKRLAEKSVALNENLDRVRVDIQQRFNEIQQVFSQIEAQVNQSNYQPEFKLELKDIKSENEILMQQFVKMQQSYEFDLEKIKADVRNEIDNEFKLIEDEVNKMIRQQSQNQVDQIQDLILNLNLS